MAEEKHKRGRQKGKAINEEWLRADDKQNWNRGRRGEEKREKGIPPEIITKGRAFPARRVTPYTHTRVTSLPRTVRSFSFQEGVSTVRAESKRKEKKRPRPIQPMIQQRPPPPPAGSEKHESLPSGSALESAPSEAARERRSSSDRRNAPIAPSCHRTECIGISCRVRSR